MADFLRSICIVSCLLSGIYGGILLIYRRTYRRVLFWYAVLCFIYAINSYYTLSAYLDVDASSDLVFMNLYMASFAGTILAMALYISSFIPKKPHLHVRIFDVIVALTIIVSIFANKSMIYPLFVILNIESLAVYLNGLFTSVTLYKTVSKNFIFALVSQGIMLLSLVSGMILYFIVGSSYLTPRVFCIPLFLLLHCMMLTMEYKNSMTRTLDLAISLEETIEKIKHSDNALMCTQMKADFLYSTLELISSRCDTDPDTAEYLTVSLSKYLRHTLNFQQLKGIVPLENEIELIRSYAIIEKEKHPEIDFDFKLPNPLPEIFIPPLSIQPLMENSIEHGILPKGGKGKVTVTIVPYKDYYHIDVSDNGIGIPDDELRKLPDAYTNTARVGLYNIHTRLLSLFNKGLVLQSEPSVGTSVSFVVPPDAQRRIQEANERENKEQEERSAGV